MDIDAGADDFFAALDNGGGDDVFAGFGASGIASTSTSNGLSLDDEPLVTVCWYLLLLSLSLSVVLSLFLSLSLSLFFACIDTCILRFESIDEHCH